MKKIISIMLLALAFVLVGCENQQEKYIEECKSEFVFDYEEQVLFTEIKKQDKYFIVEIYGEKTHATYLCGNGEVWNYNNQSN